MGGMSAYNGSPCRIKQGICMKNIIYMFMYFLVNGMVNKFKMICVTKLIYYFISLSINKL